MILTIPKGKRGAQGPARARRKGPLGRKGLDPIKPKNDQQTLLSFLVSFLVTAQVQDNQLTGQGDDCSSQCHWLQSCCFQACAETAHCYGEQSCSCHKKEIEREGEAGVPLSPSRLEDLPPPLKGFPFPINAGDQSLQHRGLKGHLSKQQP